MATEAFRHGSDKASSVVATAVEVEQASRKNTQTSSPHVLRCKIPEAPKNYATHKLEYK